MHIYIMNSATKDTGNPEGGFYVLGFLQSILSDFPANGGVTGCGKELRTLVREMAKPQNDSGAKTEPWPNRKLSFQGWLSFALIVIA
jgi:hypothetical protein